MKIFESYTGNAMLNNALMTIEALAGLNSVNEITPEVLLQLYKEPIKGNSLISLNLRLKSYTMIFSLNNPLVNPAKKTDLMGQRVYDGILQSIIKNCKTEGEHICEISGLRFHKTFEDYYILEVEKLKDFVKSKKLDSKKEKTELTNLDKTDFSLNRCWFPLIGGLGSDAQALPQAKFALKIHPICIVIMQFLPLSSLLYKGGILLIDSSNIKFSRRYIKQNLEVVKQKIELVKETEPIENIKDFAKGNYLNKALELIDEIEFEEDYSDLNLWSFSNSGTGASCEIDRIPDSLIRKLLNLRSIPTIRLELKQIVENRDVSGGFISSLEDNRDWWGLYPAKKYDGVSVTFFESYYQTIGHTRNTIYAKYIAYLISKYKSKSFDKYLNKSDAYNEDTYKSDLYTVLTKATEDGLWSIEHQLQILDNQELPIKNSSYGLYKTIHFFYQRLSFNETKPALDTLNSDASNFIKWIIFLIQKDNNSKTIIKRLNDKQEYINVGYNEIFLRSASNHSVSIINIFEALYNLDGSSNRFGLNELLHLFFLQPTSEIYDNNSNLQITYNKVVESYLNWFKMFEEFSLDYQTYYFDKYENKETGNKPYNKYLNQLTSIPNENTRFLRWLDEAITNTNEFLNKNIEKQEDQWSDSILYNPNGEFSVGFARFALQLSLRKVYFKTINNN